MPVLDEQARLRSANVPAHALLRAGGELRIEVGRVVAAPASAASRNCCAGSAACARAREADVQAIFHNKAQTD